MQEPLVRAVMDRFPGAEIVAVRDAAVEDVAAPVPSQRRLMHLPKLSSRLSVAKAGTQ